MAAGLVGAELAQVVDLVRTLHRSTRLTLIVVEHVEGVIRQLADTVIVLNWGQEIAQGTPAQIEADPRVREVYLGSASGRAAGTVASAGEQSAPARAVMATATPQAASGPAREPALRVENLRAGYGDLIAIRDVSIRVEAGQIVALLGANGAGKSTLAAAVSGLVPVISGRVFTHGTDVTRAAAHVRARNGVAHCPEGRRVFAGLTVEENLGVVVAGRGGSLAERRTGVYDIFPVLAQRRGQRAGTLSGGQQQMLAIGRALMSQPSLLICDEISLGLAPVAIDTLYEAITRINAAGVAVLLVEQSVHRSLAVADYAYVLERGEVSYAGPPQPLLDESVLHAAYFGTPNSGPGSLEEVI